MYELHVYNEDYELSVWDRDGEDDQHNRIAYMTNPVPFPSIHAGDFLDPRDWPADIAVFYEVTKVVHGLSSDTFRTYVFVKRHLREVPET